MNRKICDEAATMFDKVVLFCLYLVLSKCYKQKECLLNDEKDTAQIKN